MFYKRQLLALMLISPLLPAMDLPNRNEFEQYYGASQREMEAVFASAPAKAQRIVKHLQNPDLYQRREYRAAFFVGIPGTGKSTLAKAIAYKLGKPWACDCVAATQFQGEARGQTAMQLREFLEMIVKIRPKTLVVIDELNLLLEHSESKYHDTDATSKTLWTFLDSQRGNHNFFLIGTMNTCEDIPDQIKQRLLARIIIFSAPASVDGRKAQLLINLLDDSTQLHAECDNQFFNELLTPLTGFVGRDFSELALAAIDILRGQDEISRIKVIRKQHLVDAVKTIQEIKAYSKYGKKKEADEDRQERHFVQQQWAQMILGYYSCGETGLNKEGRDKLKLILTKEQKAIVEKIIQDNTPAQVNNAQSSSNGCAIQ